MTIVKKWINAITTWQIMVQLTLSLYRTFVGKSVDITLNSAGKYVQNNSRIPLIISIAFALLAAMSIIYTVVGFHIANTASKSQVVATHRANLGLATPNLSRFHLFGQYQGESHQLPQTTLQLTLQGVALAITPGQASRAIISSNGLAKIYQTGQTVPGGATIKAIDRSEVILLQNNTLQSLKLPIPKLINNGIYTSEKH